MMCWKGKTMKKAIGVDISKYDKTFDPDLSIYPLDFVVVRVGHSWNGIFYEDPRYLGYLPNVEKVPIRLAYCYLNSGTTLNVQVEEFLDSASKAPFEWDGFVCDWESAYNDVSQSFADKGVQWIKQVGEATGLPVILYTNISLYEDYWQIRGKDLPLWLAWPLENNEWTIDTIHYKTPRMPEGRTEWDMWQFSHTLFGTDWGLGRAEFRGDGDMFNGTVEDMKKFLKGDDTPVTPTDDKVLVDSDLLAQVEADTIEYKKVQSEFALVAKKLQEAGDKLTANVNNLLKTVENPEDPDPVEEPEYEQWTTLVGLNVRSEPFVADNKIGAVAAGVIVNVYRYDDSSGDLWGLIDTGWIALNYQGYTYAEKVNG